MIFQSHKKKKKAEAIRGLLGLSVPNSDYRQVKTLVSSEFLNSDSESQSKAQPDSTKYSLGMQT